MQVVRVVKYKGFVYRVLRHPLGFYLIQKKIKVMDWRFTRDWYGPEIFFYRKNAIKKILMYIL